MSLLSVLAIVVAALAAYPSPAAAEASLALDPASGPAGTTVTATVSGFEDCQTATGDPGTVSFSWDGAPLDGTDTVVDAGTAQAQFQVPADAATGKHDVHAACTDVEGVQATATFKVVPVTVAVPDLTGLSLDQARQVLAASGLTLGSIQGSGDTVESQDPLASTEVDEGTQVDVTISSTPVPVTVPNVVGKSLDDAKAALKKAGLSLAPTDDPGVPIASQNPSAGSEVLEGSAVTVTFESTSTIWWAYLLGALAVLVVAIILWAVFHTRKRRWVRDHVVVRQGIAPQGRVEIETSPEETE